MNQGPIIGIDLGGTQLRVAQVTQGRLQHVVTAQVPAHASYNKVLQVLFATIEAVIKDDVAGIGMGVPGLVDEEKRLVYDVVNIPSWKEIKLFDILEDRYGVKVAINNDANCFALGEYYFGKGRGHSNMAGLTIGTGLGTGLILNHKLCSGTTGGAGEFGMAPYADKTYEYYASGQFFTNVYQRSGTTVFAEAQQGNQEALRMYSEMGTHLGNAIKLIMFSVDPSLIVLGGSVRFAYPHFQQSMWQSINQFPYKRQLAKLQIEVSELENSGILGAAALLL